MPNWKELVDPAAPSGRYLRWKEVERSTGLRRTTAWRMQRTGEFPRPYVISPGRVGYREAEVEAWRASRGQRSPADAVSKSVASPATPGFAPRVGSQTRARRRGQAVSAFRRPRRRRPRLDAISGRAQRPPTRSASTSRRLAT